MSVLRRPSVLLKLIAVAAALLLVGACSGSDPSTGGASTGETRTVQTVKGEVTIPAAPQKIVVLNHALAGYVFNLEIPVAATVPEFTDVEGKPGPGWAEQAQAAGTQFLPWPADGFNLESIAAAQPDLIIAGGLGLPFAQADKAYGQLSQVAPTVLVDKTLQTWQQQFEFIATDVFDKADRYTALKGVYDERVSEVAAAIKPKLPPTPSTFLLATVDGSSFGLMDDSGIVALFADLGLDPSPVSERSGAKPYTPGGDMFEISLENIGDVIDTPTVFVTGFTAGAFTVDKAQGNKIYAKLPAFAGKHAYDIPSTALRGDYDDTLALLDHVETLFG